MTGLYTLNSGEITGTISDRIWIGTHTFIIKGTNGEEGSSLSPRGNDGLFDSLDSVPISVTIVDPCSRSIVDFNDDFDGIFPRPVKVPVGQSIELAIFDGPTDSMSDELASSGFDLCGPLLYELTDKNGNEFPTSLLDLDVVYKNDAADELTLTLTSLPYGNEVTIDIVMDVSLIGFPTATPAKVKGTIVFRECAPGSFDAEFVLDQFITVGQKERLLKVEFY